MGKVGSSGQKKTVLCYLWDIKASSGTAFVLSTSVSPLETLKTEVVVRLQTWKDAQCYMSSLVI